MGGDGGVIASNRKYLRGAGTANHTADASRSTEHESEKAVVRELMTLCYLTKAELNFRTHKIVTDSYGRLYNKEAAVEALLRRKSGGKDELGSHVRGLKDLYDLKFEVNEHGKPICPVTSVELNGWNVAYVVLKATASVNVLSERAIKEMGVDALGEDYGDMKDLIRLAPPPSMMEEIIIKVKEKRDSVANTKKSSKKKDKKRKQSDNISTGGGKEAKTEIMQAAKQRVQSAVKANSVLSSIFQESKKETADDLFARG
jgi:hypothetical protein